MFNHKLPSDFPMQTLRKKSSPCKYKNEPGRFLGEGVSFRAKLIGVLEVPEARGDRMCQEALADLKMAIRAAGEHKQRIQVHVAIDGLRLRDDKTGDSLYHHPVHKISFIAQDMTDSRAFGYIFGAPDTGHRFFGIKTDKAASQVVIAMRDLFQVVFELKKKEVEMAKQNLEGKPTTSLVRHTTTSAEAKAKIPITSEASTSKPPESEGVAELVDLEQELSSLRRGLTQVEGLTPSTDPFGDSFTVSSQKGLLPPPPTARSRPTRTASPHKPALFDLAAVAADFEPQPAPLDTLPEPAGGGGAAGGYDVFTELDPLGTGRSRPYVDKKLFFQELKNPPKKVLKDLVPATQMLTDLAPEPKPESYGPTTIMTSLSRQSGGTVSVAKPAYGGLFSSDPFAETDPFDNTDPFSDTFKDDPFTSMQEFPKLSSLRTEEFKSKLTSLSMEQSKPESGENVFNGPLQVTLPPEPVPKSPRLQRQATDTSTIRQRPQPSNKADNASPPPPLPPKKPVEPPPRPPHDDDAPPLPKPVRKKEPYADRSMKPRAASLATSSEDEYLAPAPPPLPAARRLDITLSQLLTASVDELAARLRVPAATLSSMTLPQLTEYLRSYVAAENEKAHIHVEQPVRPEKEKITAVPITVPEKPAPTVRPAADFKPQFEDNFAPSETNDTFVANFDDFDKKVNPSYDKYAAFREIQEELKSITIIEPDPPGKQDNEDNELASIERLIQAEEKKIEQRKENKSPLKTLDELTMDTFNMFRNSISPKPIDEKIEDIKTVMKNLQIEKERSSVSPRDNGVLERKEENDRYAALREITITEPTDEFESIPPEAPKERKRSDEKSDGFDNSDFFDCIDNSSLTFSHVEDAFRKSPVVVPEEKKEEKKSPEVPVRETPPARLSAGSVSDVVSGSSPDTKGPVLGVGVGVGVGMSRLGWAEGWSSDSRDSEPRARRTRPHRGHNVQTSSSSRDVSPWDEEPMPRPAHHASRHNSSGSRECLDSGSGREKEKKRDKSRDISRDGRESARDRRDSGSGRDRRDSKERDIKDHRERERRDRRSRERDKDTWSTDRNYSRDRDYRDSRSRERHTKDYRDIERHRAPRRSYDEDDYSDGCGSGRSSPRDRWRDTRWRKEDRHYGSLGWRDSRRRHDMRQSEDTERRYGSTLAWPGRRSTGGSRRESERDHRDSRDSGRDSRDARDSGRDSGRDSRGPRGEQRDSGRESRDASGRESGRDARDSGRDSGRDSRDRESRDMRRRRRDERPRHRDYRFSNDFSPREREHASPFDNDFQEPPPPVTKKRAPYSSLEGTRFAFETEDTASPGSVNSPAARFRFDSDSLSPRSMFEDDFTVSTPRARTASIAEEDEDLPPLRAKPPQQHKDIKKSDSVNIFTRESDPFEGDSFFACTGSDRVARRENWPGDFKGFDNA
ncbi:protein disabled isoform X2 [Aricia agestis]|uniref:protein disabled isoform X2 n=1 Tax=Aricia agestis TaxID=91739 RepID=UPI001C209F2F|nr:protein disabled isoform X2 [Aricia agestis]